MTETAKFTSNFDKFFDVLNVKSLTEGKHKRKESRLPYASAEDPRLDVSDFSYDYKIIHLVCCILVARE